MSQIKVRKYWRDDKIVSSYVRGAKTKRRRSRAKHQARLIVQYIKLTLCLVIFSGAWFVCYQNNHKPAPSVPIVQAIDSPAPALNGAKDFESADLPRDTEPREARPESVKDMIKRIFGKDSDNALKIADCESGFRPDRVNDNPKTKDYSIGLFQINLFGDLAKTRPSEQALKDPETNILWAKKIFDDRGGFAGAWSVCSRINNIKN